ncbi:MAG TPA: phosphatidylserine decarboxylase family protein, partial [Planctomycetia bacterium]|nr:phosphatidylserine decarboxylase family protein [Planctomycetia bacterium]
MPLNIPSSQPGGGRIFDLEQGWGAMRRAVLRQFFPKYVAAMKERLRGNIGKLTLDVVDSRDLKFHGPHAGVWFDVADDPFAWRSQIPLARWGFAEM